MPNMNPRSSWLGGLEDLSRREMLVRLGRIKGREVPRIEGLILPDPLVAVMPTHMDVS